MLDVVQSCAQPLGVDADRRAQVNVAWSANSFRGPISFHQFDVMRAASVPAPVAACDRSRPGARCSGFSMAVRLTLDMPVPRWLSDALCWVSSKMRRAACCARSYTRSQSNCGFAAACRYTFSAPWSPTAFGRMENPVLPRGQPAEDPRFHRFRDRRSAARLPCRSGRPAKALARSSIGDADFFRPVHDRPGAYVTRPSVIAGLASIEQRCHSTARAVPPRPERRSPQKRVAAGGSGRCSSPSGPKFMAVRCRRGRRSRARPAAPA
jgi:hypothetical protein